MLEEVLEFFNVTTQSSLSAFHKAGESKEYLKDIEKLLSIANDDNENMSIMYAKKEGDYYIRYFKNGLEDKVKNLDEVYKSPYDIPEFFKKFKAMKTENYFYANFKESNHFNEADTLSSKLFFNLLKNDD